MASFWDSLYNEIFKQMDSGRIAGGKPVDSSTYNPAYSENDVVPIAIDKTTGGLIVHQADSNKDLDSISTYEGAISKRIDESSETITYIGEAVTGSSEIASVWRIRKIDFNNPITIKWAGTAAFDQVWSNRASLTYT
jgi:hypothetical protein